MEPTSQVSGGGVILYKVSMIFDQMCPLLVYNIRGECECMSELIVVQITTFFFIHVAWGTGLWN
jgi:hypothetical protein